MESYICVAIEALQSGASLYQATVLMWNAGAANVLSGWAEAITIVRSIMAYL